MLELPTAAAAHFQGPHLAADATAITCEDMLCLQHREFDGKNGLGFGGTGPFSLNSLRP